MEYSTEKELTRFWFALPRVQNRTLHRVQKMVSTRRLSNTKGKGRIKKERTTGDPLQFIEKKDFKNKEEDNLEKRNRISRDFLCFRGKKQTNQNQSYLMN